MCSAAASWAGPRRAMPPSAGRGGKHCPLPQGTARVSLSGHWASPSPCPSLPKKMSPVVSALPALSGAQARAWVRISRVLSSPCTSTTIRPDMLAVSYITFLLVGPTCTSAHAARGLGQRLHSWPLGPKPSPADPAHLSLEGDKWFRSSSVHGNLEEAVGEPQAGTAPREKHKRCP